MHCTPVCLTVVHVLMCMLSRVVLRLVTRSLSLQRNALTGDIPVSLWSMTNLV
jgi:hypothetical protein